MEADSVLDSNGIKKKKKIFGNQDPEFYLFEHQTQVSQYGTVSLHPVMN